MRSLIILEVEHGETTDHLHDIVASVNDEINYVNSLDPTVGLELLNYTVRVDLPECFRLES